MVFLKRSDDSLIYPIKIHVYYKGSYTHFSAPNTLILLTRFKITGFRGERTECSLGP